MAVKIATPPSKVSIVDTNGYGEINTPLNLPTFAPPLEPPSHIGSFIGYNVPDSYDLKLKRAPQTLRCRVKSHNPDNIRHRSRVHSIPSQKLSAISPSTGTRHTGVERVD